MTLQILRGALGALALLPVVAPSAQLSEPGRPTSDWADLALPVPTSILEAPDVAALVAEDAVRGPFPLRYGEVIETDLGIAGEAGVWEGVETNDAVVWRLRIASPGAHSLGIVFDEYEIPVGGQVFLYDDDKETVLGAYTDSNNNVNGLLGIQPIAGDAVTIEYVQESWVTGTPRLHVGEVIHDYKGVFNLLAQDGGGEDGAGEGGCGLVDINCPEGAPYQTEKRAVMRTLVGGGLCSAALLNNTANDGTPYMLTANHCGNMTSGQFLFEYEQASCGTAFGPQSSMLSGAVKLASTSTYDSQLYRINTQPPAGFEPYFAGWSRASSPGGGPAVTIGHGGGGPKNMAIDNTGASTTSTQWQVTWHTSYIIGGNSGGPLFNGAKRVIGPACCVNTFTCGSQTAWYGRFDRFWQTQNLAQWLDPAGTGQTNLDGFDPFAAPPILIGVTPSSVPAFGGGTVTLSGTGFLGSTEVHVGGTTLTAPLGFSIVDDNTITFGAGAPSSLGAVPVTVVKPAGTSNAVNLTYVATNPPALSATGLTLPGFTSSFSFGAQPNDLWFLFVSINDPTTVPFQGSNVLLNAIFITNGTLSAVGTDSTVVPVPANLSGATIYSQIGLLDDATFAFVGATNVAATTVF